MGKGDYIFDAIAAISKRKKELEDNFVADVNEYDRQLEARKKDPESPITIQPIEEKVVIRVETDSGAVAPFRLLIYSVYNDYITARTKNNPAPENYSFSHITNWMFKPYVKDEWKGQSNVDK